MPRCSYCQEKVSPVDLIPDDTGDPICKECNDFGVTFVITKKGTLMKGKWGSWSANSFYSWEQIKAEAAGPMHVIGEEFKNAAGNVFKLIHGGKKD